VLEILKVNIASGQRHFSLICHKVEAQRSPDTVLETFPQQQEIGTAETIVLVAAEGWIAHDVRAAQCVQTHHTCKRPHGQNSRASLDRADEGVCPYVGVEKRLALRFVNQVQGGRGKPISCRASLDRADEGVCPYVGVEKRLALRFVNQVQGGRGEPISCRALLDRADEGVSPT